MAREFDVVVVGAGIAGLTAGAVAAGARRSTLILAGGVFGGHLLSIERIENYPGFPEGVAGYELCPTAQGEAAEAGAEFAMEAVDKIDATDGGFHLRAGAEEYAARAAIVATGTSLKELGLPNEGRLRGKGVSHCASCDAPLLRGRAVAVVGGGDSACQEALTLAESASRVTILQEGDSLTAQQSFQDRVTADDRIEVRYGVTVADILGEDTVSGVRVTDATGATEDLAVDGVFVYVGLAPNTGFLHGLVALDETGGIVTDSELRTDRRGLFAAGTVRAGAACRAAASADEGTAAAKGADRFLSDGVWR